MRTISNLADDLDAVRGLNGSKSKYYLRHLRAMSTAGILLPAEYDGHGKTAAALFDEVGCVSAHFAIYFLEYVQLDVPSVHAAVLAVQRGEGRKPFDMRLLPPSQHVAGGFTPGDNLVAAINGAKAGEKWSLNLRKITENTFTARFSADDFPIPQPSARAQAQIDRVSAGKSAPIPVISVPVSEFIAAMLKQIEA